MQAKQKAKLNMYRVIEKHCVDNAEIIAITPAFQAAFNLFKAQIVVITGLVQQSDLKTGGIATDKDNYKQKLCQIATDTANSIYAFASTVDNQTLKEEMNFTVSKLLQTRDDQLAPRCQNIHDRGRAFMDDLGDYGINDDVLKALQKAINNYSAEIPKTRSAVSIRKTSFSNLAKAFKTADDILRNRMDKLVGTFRAEHPEFVATYEAGRVIVDASRTTTQLKGKITAEADGKEIKNATVTIVELNLKAVSDSHGDYSFKPVKNGKFTIRVSAEGYQTKEIDEVEVKRGVNNSLNVKI